MFSCLPVCWAGTALFFFRWGEGRWVLLQFQSGEGRPSVCLSSLARSAYVLRAETIVVFCCACFFSRAFNLIRVVIGTGLSPHAHLHDWGDKRPGIRVGFVLQQV